jgi:hypothetical protein
MASLHDFGAMSDEARRRIPLDDLGKLVAEWFPGPFGEEEDGEDFRRLIVESILAGQRLHWLGERLGCEPVEIVRLKGLEREVVRRWS